MEQVDPAGFRTSPQQRHLWTVSDRPGTAPWVQLEVLVEGVLDSGRLDGAVRHALTRHEILRTRVGSIAGHTAPVQVIDEVAPGLSVEHDLSDVPEVAAQLQRLVLAERERLDGSPVRVTLARLGAERSVLVLTAPAVVADGPSLRRLLSELAAGYAGVDADPVSVQYADYAAWHNDLLEDADRLPRRSYWDGRVAPALAGIDSLRTAAGAEPGPWRAHRARLTDGVLQRLSAFSAETAADEQVVLAAAWLALLWRMYGEQDLPLLVRVSGRSYPELDAAIGPFARDVPIAGRLTQEHTFRVVVEQVRSQLDGASAHVDDLDTTRVDPGVMFDAPGFEYLDPARPISAAGLVFRPVAERSRPVSPLVLRAGRDARGCWVELGYDPHRLLARRADELLERALLVLDAVLGSPDAPITAAGMLLPGERDRLLSAAHGAVAAPSGPAHARTLQHLVGAQARRTPGNIAVDDGAGRLTYAELDERSERFARLLVASGVCPGSLVVIVMERSASLLVSVLAVLKAGAAFVPVDLQQPPQRLAFLLADTASPVLVTGPGTALPAGLDVPVVRVTEALDDPAGRSPGDAEPLPEQVSDDIAYVMYTSGSAGTPHGVQVSHGALLNYLTWAADAYDLRSGTGALVHSSIGFDLTITGLLGPLLVGQRVVLVPESDGLGGLVSALRGAEDLSLLKLTPSHLIGLSQLMDSAQLAGRVRTVVVGGEPLRAEVLDPLRTGAPGTRIVNEYGPTETVVGSCAHLVDEPAPHSGPVPIGRPIAGASVYLLDAALTPVPDGVAGELHIGGAGVATGYLGQAGLTRERFGDDPFVPGGRLYRTGDRARRNHDGDLVFLGRTDDQLKIGGVRVEPGEVEAVLREHPGVGQAAVGPGSSSGPAGPSGDGPQPIARLVACIVAVPGSVAPSGAELSAHCRLRLPEYLVPAAFVPVAALPTTANAKLDRAAVARIVEDGQAVAPYAAPRSATEEILAGAIAAVLARHRVGVDDNYFVIGGDSIRSVMVASRVQARGLSVSVADLHRYPTVRELAVVLAAGDRAEPELRTEPFALVSAQDRALIPADIEDAFPLNLLQEGMIFHRDFAAKSAVYHAIASVRLVATLDLGLLRSVIRRLVQRHPMLRTSFDQTTFSRPLQLVHSVFRDPLSYEDLTGLSPGERDARIRSWVDSEKQRGFELDEHPLIRFMVQKLDEESFQFTYGFHHEIIDGWSEALMVTELFGHYFSEIFAEPITLTPPRTTMRDAVALELQALGRAENYEFWSDYLRDATLMRLPRLDSGPSADKGAREIVRIAVPVPAELSDSLKRLANATAVPLKSVLLAAHMAVMNQYHGQPDTLTYTVTNGRPESVDGSTAIGLFVNSLALRLSMTGGTWNELIEATMDSERRSMPYRRLPMAELKRHQGNEPLAETLFFFTDYHVFRELDRWRGKGVEHVASELYGESTFPFCAIFRLNRETSRLEVRIEYDSLQFPATLMEDMADCYTRVLQTMVANPGARYDAAPLMSEQQLHHVLVEWNGSGPALDGAARIHDLIERRARETPDAIAITHGDAALSYAALDRLAGRAARRLAEYGAGPERIVALLAERSMQTVICLLGILRSGAAYLPLDPTSPDDRTSTIIEGADPVAVLVQPGQDQRIGCAPPVIPMTHLVAECAGTQHGTGGGSAGPDIPPVVSGNAAYVMHTSGSTGAPKGVVVTHRALVNSTLARCARYREHPARFLLLSPLGFDSSVAGLFWPLCTGGTLVLAPEGMQWEPAALCRYLEEQSVTHTLAIPSLLTALLQQDQPRRLRSLRVVIAAGEASSRELYDEHRAAVPGSVFANEYGPTENTVWSTLWTGRPVPHRPQLPIGRPVPGVRAYVLSWQQLPVPVGVAGELSLGGAGLARGYLGRPALTAAVFVPDPYGEPGARMYRTGDLARYTPDGELEFLGRTDHQVKIRGFRVELGEIEGVLDAHPDVHRSVVLARDHGIDGRGIDGRGIDGRGIDGRGTGEQSLVAYVAARPGATPAAAELQRYVRDRLPKYMVPASCVVLDVLPLSATGKIDRSSLPAPQEGSRPDAELVSPRTETEQVIADIWRQALGRAEIGVHDEFFEIGGESLRAMQVVTRCNKVFGLNLSVRSVFDAPTIATFATTVDEARTAVQV